MALTKTTSRMISLSDGVLATGAGAGITDGSGTIYANSVIRNGGIVTTEIIVDITGLNCGDTAGDIIGLDDTGVAYLGQVTLAQNGTIFSVRMECLEAPGTGDADIDLYSADEATGVEDSAIAALTETQIINSGSLSAGSVVYGSTIASGQYLYLVGQGTGDTTYTAGKLKITLLGYV